MKKDKIELLSRLMDNDLHDRASISQISNEPESLQIWSRLSLIRDSMQNTLPEQLDLHLHKRVMSELQNESIIFAPRRNKVVKFIKPAAGFAIAASVMTAVLIGVQTGPLDHDVQQQIALEKPQMEHVDVNTESIRTVAVPSNSESPINTIPEATLNRYLVDYNEYRANRGIQGMVPYVRIVGYEAEK